MPLDKAVLAGGCFWCIEALVRELKGIQLVECGYAVEDGNLDETGRSISTEAVQVTFRPNVISYEALVSAFLLLHNPMLSKNKTGIKYRSAIFYTSEEQKGKAQKAIASAQPLFSSAITTEVLPLLQFEKAPENQQQYYAKNPLRPYCQTVILPKLNKLREMSG